MSQTYLVRTTFKSGGKVFLAGDLLDDLSEVRLFKVRMNEGKLVPLPEGKDLDNLSYYFKEKYGIDLKARVEERASKGSDLAEDKKPDASIPPTGTPKKSVVPPASVIKETPKAPVVEQKPTITSTQKQTVTTKPQPLSGVKPIVPMNTKVQPATTNVNKK